MSAFGYHDGQRETARGTLSDTSVTTLLSATNNPMDVVSVILVNHSGSARTPTLDINDGTDTFILRDNASLADTAREVTDIGEFLRLKRGDSLRLTSDANLAWFVSYVIPYKPTGPR